MDLKLVQLSNTSTMNARLEAAFESWSAVDTTRTVYLGNLPEYVYKTELQEILSHYGKVEKIALSKEQKTKKFKGYGKAIFADPQGAKAALAAGKAFLGFQLFQIKKWIDPLTYINQRDMKAHRKVYLKHKSVHTKESLLDYFQRFGPIEEIDMRFNYNSTRSRNFCYIVFRSSKAAQAAANIAHELLGQMIICEMCRPTNPLRSLTIIPNDTKIETENDHYLQKDKNWQDIKQYESAGRPDVDSIIWRHLPKNNYKLVHPKKSNIGDPIKPINEITSLNIIARRKKIYQKQAKNRQVYGCNHAESWLQIDQDNYRLQYMDANPDFHFTKPTSSRYSKFKTGIIESLHKQNNNILFKKLRHTSSQRPSSPEAYTYIGH